jgi:hypothetical protein
MEVKNMEPQDIEQVLKSAKFRHLSEATLVSYRDEELDEIGLALADAHLKLCAICENKLNFLMDEEQALESYAITGKDRELIQRAIRKVEPEKRNSDFAGVQSIVSAMRRLATYFTDLQLAWVVQFSEEAMRGTPDGDEVFRYRSEDGGLLAWAILEKDASLTVHFSSSELSLEGARIRFQLGPFSQEVTLQREGDSSVAAKIEIPRSERAKNMANFSIRVI